jgi:hypothetical protein
MSLLSAANNIIDRHGYDVTFVREKAGGTYDTETRTIAGATALTWTAKGVFVSYTEVEVDGTSVLQDDRKLLLRASPMTNTPQPGDIVDDTVKVLTVRKMQVGSTVLGYICQTRG